MNSGPSHWPAVRKPRAPRGLRGDCVLALVAAFLLASCRQAGVTDPQGPVAAAEWLLMINATEIMLVVVVPVILATLVIAWWYRSTNSRASRDPGWAYQGSVEFVTWSIPALIVILWVACAGSARMSSIRGRRSPPA